MDVKEDMRRRLEVPAFCYYGSTAAVLTADVRRPGAGAPSVPEETKGRPDPLLVGLENVPICTLVGWDWRRATGCGRPGVEGCITAIRLHWS